MDSKVPDFFPEELPRSDIVEEHDKAAEELYNIIIRAIDAKREVLTRMDIIGILEDIKFRNQHAWLQMDFEETEGSDADDQC